MKKLLMGSIVLTVFAISVLLFQLSCKKEANSQTSVQAGSTDQSVARICDVKGVYYEQVQDQYGNTSAAYYKLGENNFISAGPTVDGTNDTFGGYSNDCDSVFLRVYYEYNHCYYFLKGKLKNHKTVISGTFQNLTQTGNYGTFTMTKQ